jgi:hypothetical protein
VSAAEVFADLGRRVSDIVDENQTLRSIIELMAMRIPAEHMPDAERVLLAEVLDNE